jgi:hypothetical protein
MKKILMCRNGVDGCILLALACTAAAYNSPAGTLPIGQL